MSYENLILSFTLFGSIHLMGKTLDTFNQINALRNIRNDASLIILNSIVFIGSGITFMYCVNHIHGN